MNIEDGSEKASASVGTSCVNIEDGTEKASTIDGSLSMIGASNDTFNVCYFKIIFKE